MDAPRGWGARRCRGSVPHAVFKGGIAIVHRPLDGWVGMDGQHSSNAGEGGKARVFDCAIGVQSVLSSTHAHPTCASSPRTARALLGNRPVPSPPPEMPMGTTALP